MTISSVYIFGSYTYVAAGTTGLDVYNGTGIEFQPTPPSFTPSAIVTGSTKVNAVIVDSNQDVIAATDNGLNILYSGTSSFQATPILSGMAVSNIFLDNNANLYAATSGGLYKITSSSAKVVLSGAVSCVYVDGAGTIYAGTATGLQISKDSGSTWTASTWSAAVNAVVTTAPLYSF